MAKNYKVVFQATIDTKQLETEAKQALSGVKLNVNAGGIKSVGAAAKTSSGLLGEFGTQLKNLPSTLSKVAAFGVATSAIGLFTDALRSGVDAVFEMDAALVE